MADGYGRYANPDVLAMVPAGDSVLDVGCGAGALGVSLRPAGFRRIVGIEPDARRAETARGCYDEVVSQAVEEVDLRALGPFDVVVTADVLEHLVDPWRVLADLADCTTTGGHLIVSVPNARSVDFLLPLLWRGRLDYTEEGGLMDVGHLRWFTKRTLGEALVVAGWRPESWVFRTLGRKRQLVRNVVRLPVVAEALSHQLVVRATKA